MRTLSKLPWKQACGIHLKERVSYLCGTVYNTNPLPFGMHFSACVYAACSWVSFKKKSLCQSYTETMFLKQMKTLSIQRFFKGNRILNLFSVLWGHSPS